MNLQEVKRKARYGHKDWIFWHGQGQMKTPDTIKKAMLACGTQEYFLLVCANDGHTMLVNWRTAVTMLNNAKRGY